jgi:hypothetical protein
MVKLMKILNKNSLAAAFLLSAAGLSGATSAAEQIISATSSLSEIGLGDETVVTVIYDATEGSLTTGLGLRLHFDSSKLTAGDLGSLLQPNFFAQQVQSDTSNFDNDSSTDRFVTVSWASFTGSNWPADTVLPATLFSLPFTGASSFAETSLNFTASSVAAGYTLNATNLTIAGLAPPVITPPDNITVGASSAQGAAASVAAIADFLAAAVAVDNVDGSVSVGNDAPDQFPIGETTVTFSAVDALGNTSESSAVVTVADISAPVILAPDALNTYAISASGTPATEAPIAAFLSGVLASDNIDAAVGVTTDAPEVFPLGSTTVTFTATDSAGNGSIASAVVTVFDLTAPTLQAPANITVAAVDANGTVATDSTIAAFLLGASATDNVDSSVSIGTDALAVFPVGATTVTFSATDTAGNESSVTAIVTVQDQNAPVVTAPANITVAAVDASGTPATDEAIAVFLAAASSSDNSNDTLTVTNDAPAVLPLGSTTITFSSTDSAQNTGTATAAITVTDQTSPVINVPETFAVLGTDEGVSAAEESLVSLLTGASASDNVDTAILAINNDAPQIFPFGSTSVTFTAEDAAGNTGTAVTVVTVSLDIVPPELVVPDLVAINVNMPGDVIAADNSDVVSFFAGVSASDNKDGDLTSLVTDDRPSEFPVGETVITFTVADAAGNKDTAVSSIVVVVLDTDSDGLPDFYETANGLNPEDASDASGDLDGDGISNLDEYANGSNPTKDELAPELVIPSDVSVVATGRLTSVELGTSTAVDNKDGELAPIPSKVGPFVSGSHEVVWSVADAAGNVAESIQLVTVLPLVNLPPSVITTEGSTVEINVVMSGVAAQYPVIIPLSVSGTAIASDFSLSSESLEIIEGISGTVVVTILADAESETLETVVVSLGEPDNAALGSVTDMTIRIVEENVAPQLGLSVEQSGNVGRIVSADAGVITITADVSDLNSADTTSLEWDTEAWVQSVDVAPDLTLNGNTISFDPSALAAGTFSLSATVTDNGSPVLTTTKTIAIKLLAASVVLSDTADSDGDGVLDADEGMDDSDGDGIPDYQDNIVESYLAPVDSASGQVMQAAVGTKITLGDSVFEAGTNSVGISEEQLVEIVGSADSDFDYPGGLFDFKVSGAAAGESYRLVLPLSSVIPENAVFRKFIDENIGWQEFVINATNSIATALALGGACPEPGSTLFVDGLNAGDTCVELYIEDGGPNDTDGVADGTVTDPSGLAVLYFGAPSSESTITLSVSELKANGSETATITVTAKDSDGRLLEGMTVSASATGVDATIGSFSEVGDGVYTGTLMAGKKGGSVTVNATISNGTDSVTLSSASLELKKTGGGGCTVVANQSPDISLVLLMCLGILLMLRRRWLNGSAK